MCEAAILPDRYPAFPARLALAVLGLAALAAELRAQPVLERLTRADGLPSDYVLAVYQDRWGFMWFGTDAGAVRWDGRTARAFSVDDGLPHAYVQGLAETADGTLSPARPRGGEREWRLRSAMAPSARSRPTARGGSLPPRERFSRARRVTGGV